MLKKKLKSPITCVDVILLHFFHLKPLDTVAMKLCTKKEVPVCKTWPQKAKVKICKNFKKRLHKNGSIDFRLKLSKHGPQFK